MDYLQVAIFLSLLIILLVLLLMIVLHVVLGYQEYSTFGKEMPELDESRVEQKLRELAYEFLSACRSQEKLLGQNSLIGEEAGTLVKVTRQIQESKRRFWDTHKLAKSRGVRVHDSVKQYCLDLNPNQAYDLAR